MQYILTKKKRKVALASESVPCKQCFHIALGCL